MPRGSAFTRREFLGTTAAGVASGLLAGCSNSTATPSTPTTTSALGTNAHVAPASDAPETPDLKFGMIALTDCSPIVIAHEKGLFKK